MADYIEEARQIAKNKGGECLSDTCPSIKSYLDFRCKGGHEWSSLFGNIKYHNNWCKKCTGISQRRTIFDCKKLAEAHNGRCLSTIYNNNFEKLEWECENKHIWMASFNKISIGRWCPHCSRKFKHTIEVAKRIAIERGGLCLSDHYINLRENLIWQCKFYHIWSASLNNIKNHNKWCPECAINAKKYDISVAKNIALTRGGLCLSEEYINSSEKLIWQCAMHHVWKASLKAVKRGTWCPFCNNFRKTQEKLSNIIKELFNTTIYNNYKGFGWLKIKKGRQEIDIWVPDLKLAIEYDGEQHFRPVTFGGCSKEEAKKNFERTLFLDKVKNKKISKHPEDIKYFIRFDYREKNKLTKEYVLQKLKEYNVPIEAL